MRAVCQRVHSRWLGEEFVFCIWERDAIPASLEWLGLERERRGK